LVVLTMIRFLAYTLSLVFYHRQVRSHARRKCETGLMNSPAAVVHRSQTPRLTRREQLQNRPMPMR